MMSASIIGSIIFALLSIFIDVLLLNSMLLTLAGLVSIVGVGLVSYGLISNDLPTLIITDSILWVLLVLVLWGVGVLFQNKPKVENCFGYVVLDSDLSCEGKGHVRFSGVDWDVVLDPTSGENLVKAGTKMVITKNEVGLLTVKPVKQ
ncbi:hypothetical protein [Photobacterium damselae]|uniref:hypothetical protein n=1 Tax=Photobacterium damselae TaxID=38293 RepID=UPI004068BAE0